MPFRQTVAVSHRIFAGSFDALELRLLEEIAARQRRDPLQPVPILVGSNILASYLKGRIASGGRAAANVRFWTFLDVAHRLGSAGRTAEKPPLPPLGRPWILERLLDSEVPAAFRDVAGLGGFRSALLDTFRDLRDGGVTAADFERGARAAVSLRGGDATPERREHLAALAALYGRFRAETDAFDGVDDVFRRAASAAPEAARLLHAGFLLVYGIYDVTGQQDDLLAALARVLDVVCFVPWVDGGSAEFARAFLDARARDLGVQVERLDSSAARPAALGALAERLFAAEAGPPLAADGSCLLVSVPGASRAATEVARAVLEAARDGAISGFHEAAVLVRHPEEDVPVLAEAFRLRQIPYFVQGGTPFAERPFCRAVAALGELEQESFARHAVLRAMEWTAAALLPQGGTWNVSEWRLMTNDPAFLAGVEAWNGGIEALVRRAWADWMRAQEPVVEPGDREPTLETCERRLNAARALEAAWRAIRDAAAGWPEALSWREWAELLEARLSGPLGTAADWSLFSTALDDLGSLDDISPEGRVPRPRMTRMLAETLASLSHPEGRFLRSGVNILSVTAARGLRFPLVIVLGLDEGRFPSHLRQDPLLLDRERRSIGAGRLPLKSERGEEEKLLFSMAVRSAERRLVLVTSRLDESSDREQIPSSFFLRAAGCLRGTTVAYADLNSGAVPGFRAARLDRSCPEEGETPVDETEIRLRLVRRDPQRALAALTAAHPALLAGPLAFDSARWQRILTPFDGRIQERALRSWIKERFGSAAGPVSASRLEEYAKCPYLFFLKRVHGLEGWDEAAAALTMDPLERGRTVHEILEAFTAEFPRRALIDTEETPLAERLSELARERLEARRPPGIADLLWDIERDRLTAALAGWLRFERARLARGDVYPAQFERAFGKYPGEDLPAPTLRAGRHAFEFRGKIDRIDLSEDGRRARVIDYKTGKLPYTMWGNRGTVLMGAERIQLPIYRSALSVLPGFEHVTQVEGEYLHLDGSDAGARARSFSKEDLEAAAALLPEMLAILGDGIEGGIFFARSRGNVWENQCGSCDFISVCGKDRRRREERKAADPAVRRFSDLALLDGLGGDE